jgi:hypothetical protein
VEIRLESWNDEVLLISGSGAELELIGERRAKSREVVFTETGSKGDTMFMRYAN